MSELVEITKVVRYSTHRCPLPSEDEILDNGWGEGTEAFCKICGRRWSLMQILTSRRVGPPWRRRTLPCFEWWPEGEARD